MIIVIKISVKLQQLLNLHRLLNPVREEEIGYKGSK